MQNAHAFGELSLTIRHQLSDDFNKEQDAWLAKNLGKQKVNGQVATFTANKTQGAFAYWHRPNENVNEQIANLYAKIARMPLLSKNYLYILEVHPLSTKFFHNSKGTAGKHQSLLLWNR